MLGSIFGALKVYIVCLVVRKLVGDVVLVMAVLVVKLVIASQFMMYVQRVCAVDVLTRVACGYRVS